MCVCVFANSEYYVEMTDESCTPMTSVMDFQQKSSISYFSPVRR